jgi:hypothetical protein
LREYGCCLFFLFFLLPFFVLPILAPLVDFGSETYKKPEESRKKKKQQKNLIACRGLGRVVGPLLAARALPLRYAASAVLSSALLAI